MLTRAGGGGGGETWPDLIRESDRDLSRGHLSQGGRLGRLSFREASRTCPGIASDSIKGNLWMESG